MVGSTGLSRTREDHARVDGTGEDPTGLCETREDPARLGRTRHHQVSPVGPERTRWDPKGPSGPGIKSADPAVVSGHPMMNECIFSSLAACSSDRPAGGWNTRNGHRLTRLPRSAAWLPRT